MLEYLALTMLAIKIWMLSRSSGGHIKTSALFLWLLSSFAFLNVAEFASISQLNNTDATGWFMRAYYTMTLCSLVLMVLYSAHVAKGSNTPIKATRKAILFLTSGATIIVLILFTDLIIKGVISLGYTRTADKGALYLIYPAFAISCLLFVAGILAKGWSCGKSQLVKIQSRYALSAFSPILIFGISIGLLMNLGFKVNAVGLMPVATTAFLWLLLRSEDIHRLTSIRLTQAANRYGRGEISLNELSNALKRIQLEHEIHIHGAVINIADRIEIDRSSVYSKQKKHGIGYKKASNDD